jgi:hypothetical protein
MISGKAEVSKMAWIPMVGEMRLDDVRLREEHLRRTTERARLVGPLRRPRRRPRGAR